MGAWRLAAGLVGKATGSGMRERTARATAVRLGRGTPVPETVRPSALRRPIGATG